MNRPYRPPTPALPAARHGAEEDRMETTHTRIDPATTRTARRRSALRNARGISIMETLVALGLFGITAASMGNFLVQQIRQASDSHLDTVAYSLAADALEEARAGDFSDLATGSTTYDQGGVTFTVNTQVQNDTPDNGLKTITAAVSWNEPSGPKNISVPVVYTQVTRF
jgi:Tfp pilus assembly protein PilV